MVLRADITHVPEREQSNQSAGSWREGSGWKTSTWWACPLQLKLQSCAVPSPLPPDPIQMKCKSPCPQFKPCRYLFNSPSIRHLSSLLDSLSLLLILPESLFYSVSSSSFQLPADVFPSLHSSGSGSLAEGYRPTKWGEFYHTELNKSIWKKSFLIDCGWDLINSC